MISHFSQIKAALLSFWIWLNPHLQLSTFFYTDSYQRYSEREKLRQMNWDHVISEQQRPQWLYEGFGWRNKTNSMWTTNWQSQNNTLTQEMNIFYYFFCNLENFVGKTYSHCNHNIMLFPALQNAPFRAFQTDIKAKYTSRLLVRCFEAYIPHHPSCTYSSVEEQEA